MHMGPSDYPAITITVVLALVLRLATLPVLVRAQRHFWRRAALGRWESGGLPAAVAGEAVVRTVSCALVILLTLAVGDYGLYRLLAPIVPNSPLVRPLHDWIWIPRADHAVLGLVCLALWLLLWFLVQLRLWANSGVPGRLAGWFLLRVALGVLVMPVALLLAGVVFQAVGLLAARRRSLARVTAGMSPVGPGSVVATAPIPFASPSPMTPQSPAHVAPQVPPQAAPYTPQAAPYVPPAASPQVARHELRVDEPRTIGGYRLLGRIGAGGMGTVYLAQREGAATQVALKTINPELLDDAELLRRFEREAEVLAMVPGAYTARVLDAGVDDGRPYLAMELLDGRPLDVHLREQGPIRSPEALRALALALAVALSGVHRLGLVHRDLKPGNIMLTSAGPRLLDFGIAAIVDGTRLTRSGGGPGTLTYMAPEQFGDEPVGTGADVWAWACCVVCAAHGVSPFAAANTGAIIRRIVDAGPDPAALAAVGALDPALAVTVARALVADPAARPADGAALLALLTADAGPGHTVPDPGTVRDQITRGWRTLVL